MLPTDMFTSMFDEPSSYLDVKQRLTAAAVIRAVVAGEENAKWSAGPPLSPSPRPPPA
jgi:translation initiation factor RLI1